MAETIKVLGQVAPAATTDTDLYTVPAATATVLSKLVVCNRNNAADAFRIYIRAGGAAKANQHAICYDVAIAANDTFEGLGGLTMEAGTVITVYAGTTTLSFGAFGSEVT